MANHKSAKKRAKQNTKRNAAAKAKKSEMRSGLKRLYLAISENNKEKAAELFKLVQSKLSKLAKGSAMKSKTASRKTSRLASQISQL